MTLAFVYIALAAAVIGLGLSFAFMLHSMTTVVLLNKLNLVNGRLRIARSRRRQAIFRFVFALIHFGLASLLAFAFHIRDVTAPISINSQFLIGLFVLLVVTTSVDGWLARREQADIASHSRAPTVEEAAALLEHGDDGVNTMMTRDRQPPEE